MTKTIINTRALLLALFILVGMSCKQESKYADALPPEESMKTFQFAGSFKAEIYAAEPLVQDPVSMVFDDNGDAYVVEMADANMPDSIKGRGQIVLLKDVNKDGRADTSIIFARGLKEATTVLPWKDGLIVTAAPNILYLKDTNGDGVSDKREILFSGFFQNNDEAQITSLRFGVDNWIYANNDGQAGKVVFHRAPEADTLNMRGADFRFRLDRNEFERTTGPGQYGQAIDDWGHRFFTKNSLHIQQVVIAWRYLHRNPHFHSAIKNISDHDPIMYQVTPAPYWRAERTRRRNKKYQTNNLDRTEYADDHFTGASGGTFYGGDAFPEEYYGSIFTGEVAGNLVHRDVLASPSDPMDPFYTATRGKSENKQEFLAATDPWFRPTNFAVGPDGYLYVVDMYRQHIETPVSIPDDLGAEMDFAAGSNMGRIYRIMPKEAGAYKYIVSDLDTKSSKALVQLLSNPNRWQRLHAHKLLIERQDKGVVPSVKEVFYSDKDPRARIQALYVLEGLGALNADIVKNALQDQAPGIRENAAILAEKFPETLPQLEKLINDPSARVAFQATLSLGEFSGENIIRDMVKVLKKYGSNSWFRMAVLTSGAGSSVELLSQLITQDILSEKAGKWKKDFLKNIAYIIGARNNKDQMTTFLDQLAQSPIAQNENLQSFCVNGFIKGLESAKNIDPELREKIKSIEVKSAKNIETIIKDLKRVLNG